MNSNNLNPKNIIPLLALLSGSCGLAYEIIYVRLFSNYFGDSYTISGVILTAVFLGIAFGAWQSRRFIRLLAYIELSIGLYALGAITLFSYWGFEIAGFGNNVFFNILKLVVLLGVPTFLIGTCVPLFTAYASQIKKQTKGVFPKIYALYNLGAFLSILLIEFVLFRYFGLQITGYTIGCINLIIGVLLLKSHVFNTELSVSSLKPSKDIRIFTALFLAGFASGVFQLFVLKLSFSIFGPLQENFAIILASAILGVSLGAWAIAKSKRSIGEILILLVLLQLVFLLFLSPFINLWSSINDFGFGDRGELFAKVIILAGYPLPIFVLLGTLVPLAVQNHKGTHALISGHLLSISSLGNGLGALLMFCVLYRYFSLPQIGIVICFLFAAAYSIAIVKIPKAEHVFVGILIALSLSFACFQLWPKVDLLLGYRVLASPEQMLQRRKTFDSAKTYRAYDQSASVVSFNDRTQSLVFNGYQSLVFGPHSKSELHEVIVGATPALFSKNTNEALVFGLGTGITAGSTARVYDRVKVVEINPAMFHIPRHFWKENRGLMQRANVEVVQEDGISTLLNDPKNYDAIVNTVTSPKYYSASKLYTTDFYEIVKTRLSNGGVYSSWFDLNIDLAGISVMLNTLESSFRQCRYFVLADAYFNAVCSDTGLTYQSTKKVNGRVHGKGLDELFVKYKFPEGFTETMTSLEIDFGKMFFIRESTDINTLDFPVIEFVVARKSDKLKTAKSLGETILENIEFQRKSSFSNEGWRSNCKNISKMSGLEFKGC